MNNFKINIVTDETVIMLFWWWHFGWFGFRFENQIYVFVVNSTEYRNDQLI